MPTSKQVLAALKTAGWRLGTAKDFLRLSPQESLIVELRLLCKEAADYMDGVPQTVNKADYRTLAKRLHLAARAPKRRSIPAGRVECPECGGAGTVQGFPKDQTCPTCNGRGSVKPKRRTKRG